MAEGVDANLVAVKYITVRLRSEKEVRNHLQRKGFSIDEIDNAIEHCIESDFIDDHKFTENFINYRLNNSKKSAYFVRMELRKFGVPDDITMEHLNIFDFDEKQLERIMPSLRKIYKEESKLKGYLVRNGFDSELIRANLEQS